MNFRSSLTLVTLSVAVCLSTDVWGRTIETATPDKAATEAAGGNSERELSFNKDIRPIISDKCFHCHGPDADNQESDFRLDTEEHALEGIVRGNADASLIIERIHDTDNPMPPTEAARQLTDQDKTTLKQWIDQGAKFEAHWAFESVPKKIAVPESGSPWVANPIDEFILQTAKNNGASDIFPNTTVEPEKWLRRITFDLTGLPPTIEELDRFLDDPSLENRTKVVDELLASDACAERLTSEWLDVARYADSYGYQRDDPREVWPYRDWVINAFKENKPYDQFVIEQLAGDLLENPTRQQILATAFNRLHSHKKEGGVAIEEFRVENVADRVHTFSAAFMGLTMECARCHDHKYDPIKTKEYYQLTAFFGNIDENGLISYFTDATPTPAMPLPSPEQEKSLNDAQSKIDAAVEQLEQTIADQESEFKHWLDQRQPVEQIDGLVAKLSFEEINELGEGDPGLDERMDEKGKKLPPEQAKKVRHMVNLVPQSEKVITSSANTLVEGYQGKGLKLSGDDGVVIPGVAHFTRSDPFTFSIWINPAETDERGVIYRRSRGWDDAGSIGYELTKLNGRLSAKLVHFWPGNAICVETDEVLKSGRWHHVAVTYDGSSKAAGLKIYVDGKQAGNQILHDSLTREIDTWRDGHDHLAIGSRFRDRGFKDGTVDEFTAFDRQLSELEIDQLRDGQRLDSLLEKPTSDLTESEQDDLREYYFLAINADASEKRSALQAARVVWNDLMDATPSITIMRELAKPRDTFLLTRGGYDDRGEQVFPETPAFLPPYLEGQPRNRLGLAKWLLSDKHPLTSRVVVNRYWQLLFGYGLVRTPEDFGLQGQTPTHPELLDWLARDLMNNHWDIRRLIKQIALSSTYLQNSVVDLETRNRDPENRLYTRGPSQRLSAEMVRDNVLAVSELLVSKIGGKPVKPYDIALAYTPLDPDKGEGLYRRSLYTFWKRTSPAPVMITMNANKREVCRLRREITPSPLQALVLLNGPQFIEAAKILAGKLINKHGDSLDAISTESFRLLTSRHPAAEELEILNELYLQQLEHYQANEDDAKEFLKTGDTPADDSLPPSRLAAATVLINAIMNLDESVRNR